MFFRVLFLMDVMLFIFKFRIFRLVRFKKVLLEMDLILLFLSLSLIKFVSFLNILDLFLMV